MKKIIIIGLITLFLILYWYAWAQDLTDKLIILTIPKYPNATLWHVDSSNGWPDGSPNASICVNSKDSQEQFLEYYHDIISKRGWKTSNIANATAIRFSGGKEVKDTYKYKIFYFTLFGKVGDFIGPVSNTGCKFEVHVRDDNRYLQEMREK